MSDPSEQVDETPGTSSSRVFANFQRQRNQGPSTNTRSHSASALRTPTPGDTPLHDAINSIQEEVEEDDLRREATLTMPLSGAPNFGDGPDSGDAQRIRGPNHMLVPKHMFERIDSFHFTILKENVINANNKNNIKKWLKAKSVFEQVDVMTLFMGLRTKPITCDTNVYGYTEGYSAISKGRLYHILPDDIYKFAFDSRKLFILMDIVFDDTFHHISEEGFKQHDGVLIFKEAMKHFEGHEARDIIFHHQALQGYKVNTKQSVKSNLVDLNTLMRNAEECNDHLMADVEKQALLLTHFYNDTRPGVATRIQTMTLMKASYAMIYKSLCEMNPMGDVSRHHALVATATKELCRRFGLGLCTKSDAEASSYGTRVNLKKYTSRPTF